MNPTKHKRVGFVGCPAQSEFDSIVQRYQDVHWIDLDNVYSLPERQSLCILPTNTCAIVKRIVDNALGLPLDAILFDEGYGKCDHARAAAIILEKRLSIPIIRTRNTNRIGAGTPICDSGLAPFDKAERILANLWHPPQSQIKAERADPPKVALWGVPAADFNFYRLFPAGTRLLGFFRCLENRTPAAEDVELWIDPGLPTVFFAQTFCHKNIIAKELASQHRGLYVDMDLQLNASIRAKVETFLRFHA